MEKATIKIDMYDAKEVHPAKECEVLVATALDNGEINCLMNVMYSDGYFNGSDNSLHRSVKYWAYMPKMKDIDAAFKEEDDF